MAPASREAFDENSILSSSGSLKIFTAGHPNTLQNQTANNNMKNNDLQPSFLCSDDVWCFDIESFTPSSFFDWLNICNDESDDGDSNYFQYSSAASVRSDQSRGFDDRSTISRTASLASSSYLPSDNFESLHTDYAAMHEVLLDGLLEDARHRRAENTSIMSEQDSPTIQNKNKSQNSTTHNNNVSKHNNKHNHETSSERKHVPSSLPPAIPQDVNRSRQKNPSVTEHQNLTLSTKSSQKRFFLRKGLGKRRKFLQSSEWKRKNITNYTNGPKTSAPTQRKSLSLKTLKKNDRNFIRESRPDSPNTPHSWSQRGEGNSNYFDIEIIHPDAILQKDKGSGSLLGSSISARGRAGVMQKLREKMDIMIEVEDNRTSAVLTRIQAIETKRIGDFIETRSIIGLKMGFLNVKYGVLLHWKQDGMVYFICLRKMCSKSFLKVSTTPQGIKHSRSMPSLQNTHPIMSDEECSLRTSTSLKNTSNSIHIEDIQLLPSSGSRPRNSSSGPLFNGKPILQPPYYVPRPKSFPPPSLEVVVLRARGLQAKKGMNFQQKSPNPFVRVSIGEESYKTNVVKKSKNPIFGGENKGDNHFILNCTMDNLWVEIFDSISPTESKLIGFCHLPVSIVEPQPQDGNIPAKEVTLPCKMVCASNASKNHTPFGFITLSLIHRNAYTCWAKEELKARLKAMKKNKR